MHVVGRIEKFLFDLYQPKVLNKNKKFPMNLFNSELNSTFTSNRGDKLKFTKIPGIENMSN